MCEHQGSHPPPLLGWDYKHKTPGFSPGIKLRSSCFQSKYFHSPKGLLFLDYLNIIPGPGNGTQGLAGKHFDTETDPRPALTLKAKAQSCSRCKLKRAPWQLGHHPSGLPPALAHASLYPAEPTLYQRSCGYNWSCVVPDLWQDSPVKCSLSFFFLFFLRKGSHSQLYSECGAHL